jgi:hypothetical protein
MLGGQRNKSVGDLWAVRARAIVNSKEKQLPLWVKLRPDLSMLQCQLS